MKAKTKLIMSEKAIVTDDEGKKRQMYIQERGSVCSSVSPYKFGSWKTNETVLNSKIEGMKPLERVVLNKNTVAWRYSESECGSHYSPSVSNTPAYIQSETAHFDEHGNYAGGTMADQSDLND